jgi:hypothetical protein
MDQNSQVRPFHLIVVVWGRTYTDGFLEYCVASLLSPGNLPALRTRARSKFLIATVPADWEYMSSTPIFEKLRQYVDLVFIEIPPCPPGKAACEHMGIGHKAACEIAFKEKAYAVALTPDCLISDGTMSRLQEHAARGIELVWVPALRFAAEPYLGHLSAWGLIPDEDRKITGTPLVISGAEMVRAGINGLHTETISYEWDASYFPHLPSAVWWRVPGENGMLVYTLSWAPFLLDFAAVKTHDTSALENWTMDGDYVFKNLGATPKIHVVQDSDEMFCSSWSPLADRAIDLRPRFISSHNWINFQLKAEGFRWAFYSPFFDPLKRKMFLHPARWHTNPINSKWRNVERKSKRTLRYCLGWGFLAFKPITYCARLVTGHLVNWEAYQERGIRRNAGGRYLAAAKDFETAIRIGPPNPALHFLRGMALLNASDREGAVREFERGLKLDPGNEVLKSLIESHREALADQDDSLAQDSFGAFMGGAVKLSGKISKAPIIRQVYARLVLAKSVLKRVWDDREMIKGRLRECRTDPNMRARAWWRFRQIAALVLLGRVRS